MVLYVTDHRFFLMKSFKRIKSTIKKIDIYENRYNLKFDQNRLDLEQ